MNHNPSIHVMTRRAGRWYAFVVAACSACASCDRVAGNSAAGDSAAGFPTDSAARVGASPVTPSPRAISADTLASGWTLTLDGVHGVRIGMRSADVRSALGLAAVAPYAAGQCVYIDAASLPRRLYFMTQSDTLVRIDVRDSTVATREGARVGDSESRIKALYGSAVRVEPHKYTGPTGHYLIMTPQDDTTRLIVFETDGERVTMYRMGRTPEVSYVEGCS